MVLFASQGTVSSAREQELIFIAITMWRIRNKNAKIARRSEARREPVIIDHLTIAPIPSSSGSPRRQRGDPPKWSGGQNQLSPGRYTHPMRENVERAARSGE